jgi:hypothetical protein
MLGPSFGCAQMELVKTKKGEERKWATAWRGGRVRGRAPLFRMRIRVSTSVILPTPRRTVEERGGLELLP